MGLLEKLWDDTVAGPRPDSGLGKLRKYNTFNNRFSSAKDSGARSVGEGSVRVTRSITIVRPPEGYEGGSPLVSPSGSTPPISPAGFTPPASPFSDHKNLRSGDERQVERLSRQERETLLLLELTDL